MNKLTELAEWQTLTTHHGQISSQSMRDWFTNDPSRFTHFNLQVGDLLLDYSKNRIVRETRDLLCQLAHKVRLSEKIHKLFSGHAVNTSENRPALHIAIRNQHCSTSSHISAMRAFCEKIHTRVWRGSTGKPIKNIVNIGIGGSYLGPLLTIDALANNNPTGLRCYFITDIDSAHINQVLTDIDPETTLFIISSKSFSTLETLTNAYTVRQWLQTKLARNDILKHFVAITATKSKALQFGLPEEQIFEFGESIGGRYSIWSAIGLPLALMIGIDNFLMFLAGARAMDKHFAETDFQQNMPVILGLLGIWYINFFAAHHHAIIPYTHHLRYLRSYLQQADMESNGKSITHAGNPIDYATGPIIWGENGCQSQHAVNQLLHQGRHLVPVDFILVKHSQHDFPQHQDILTASCLSQAQALMLGKTYQSSLNDLLARGYKRNHAEHLAKHQATPGNRPSNILFLNKLTPYNLGSLLALYEHKIFVQGCIWDINSFDQWGVELGKQLLPNILADLNNSQPLHTYDASTLGLIYHYQNLKDTT